MPQTQHRSNRRTLATAFVGVLLATTAAVSFSASPASAAGNESPDWLPFTGSYKVTNTVNAGTSNHNGKSGPAIDFGLPYGTTVRSAGAGTVTSSGYNSCAGNYVTVYHRTANRTSSYFHLSSRSVSSGNAVNAGTPLGKSGRPASRSCGYGDHLHYQELPGRQTGTAVAGRLNPGSFTACHNGRRTSYAFGRGLNGVTVTNHSYCSGSSTTPPSAPTTFSGGVSSKLWVTGDGAQVRLRVCANNLNNQVVNVHLSRPPALGYGAKSWSFSKRATGTCVEFGDMEGPGSVFTGVTYTSRAALNQRPSTSWNGGGCYSATGGKGLCDQVRR